MSLRDRINNWNQELDKDPTFNSRIPGSPESSQNEGNPYNPYQKQLKIDKQNNIFPGNPMGAERDNVTEWELINHNAYSRKRLITKAQALDIAQKEFGKAVLNKDFDKVKEFLHRGFNPTKKYDQHNAPLSHALSPEMIQLLLSTGAKYGDLGDGGEKALHTTLISAYKSFITILEIGSPDPNKFTNEARSNPLASACTAGAANTVKLLITRLKLDPNIKFDDGSTPLMKACYSLESPDNEESGLATIEYLISIGANSQEKDKQGKTAQDILDSLNKSEVLDEAQEQAEWNKLTPEQKKEITDKTKDQRNMRELNRRTEEVKQKENNKKEDEELEIDPRFEYLSKEVEEAKTSDELLDAWEEIKKLPESLDKKVLLDKLKSKTRKAEIPSDFSLTDSKNVKEEPVEGPFKSKIKRYKKRRETQPTNIFVAEPSTGLKPSIYYQQPGVIL